MIALWLIVIMLLGGIAAWVVAPLHRHAPAWVAIAALATDFALALALAVGPARTAAVTRIGAFFINVALPWIPRFGISLHLAMDGLSLLMILLTLVLGLVSVLVSWREITERNGFFHFNLLWTMAGVLGVFLAVDLFLFAFFWEVMLVPMYFIIAIWGHERRIAAAIKFFIFTQVSGLIMMVAIVGLVLAHWRATGTLTFDYFALLGTPLSRSAATWLMLGFLAAFLVKLPAVPFHTWLPDAHTEAPTAGSVILAGVLLKTGAYGLLRFVFPLFPDAAFRFAPIAMALGVVGILYGAVQAFGQTDLKRLVAYTSVSHLGFVLLGIFAWNELALQGAVTQMVAHGLSTGALFALVGLLQERIHTREMPRMGGFWAMAPRMGAMGLFFATASLGMPGLGNFIGEFLVLLGAFQANAWLAAIAALGLAASAAYALLLVQRVFHGPPQPALALPDLAPRELAVLGTMLLLLVWIGVYPQTLVDTVRPALLGMQHLVVSPPLLGRRG